MPGFLKQSTSQTVRFGPFVDSTDGNTSETALTIAQADMQLSKNGAAFAQKNAAGNATHDTDGYYSTTLNATDTDTVGLLKFQVKVAGALHVWDDFQVVEEAIYDALFASGAAAFNASGEVIAASLATQAKADVKTEVLSAHTDNGLDHLLANAAIDTDVADDSLWAQLTSSGATADYTSYVNTTDSLQAIRDRGDSAWTTGAGGTPPQLLQSTTIATLASQTSFTLTAGSPDNDAYNGAVVVVTDQSTATQKAVGTVSDYVGSTRTVTLESDPGIFTMAVGDTVEVIASLGTGATASDVWANPTRTLTAGTNIVLAKGTGITGFNDLSAAQVNAECDTAISDAALATAASLATVDTNLDAVLVDTGTTIPGTISTLQTSVNNLNDITVSDILTTQMTESYATDGVAPTLAQAIFAIKQNASEFGIVGTLLTVRRIDKTTTAETYTLDDATNPTSRTRAS